MKRTLAIAVACTAVSLAATGRVSAADVVARPAVLVQTPGVAAAPAVTTVGYRRYWGAPYYAYRPYRVYPAPYRAYYRPYGAYYAPYGAYYGPGPYYW